MTDTVSYSVRDNVAVITIANPPVNATSQQVRAGLIAAIERVEADPEAGAAVITGADRIFVGGADITEFGKTPLEPYLPDVVNRIEECSKPVVAAVNGVALGGGFEIALGAHVRLAARTARVGLPEVTLGLIPGAGGTQRLPRLIGVAGAIDIITSGRQLSAQEAKNLGIFDDVVEADDLLNAAAAKARSLASGEGHAQPCGQLPRPSIDPQQLEAIRKKTAARHKGQIAQLAAIDAVEASTRLDLKDGLMEERGIFLTLMETPQRAALIHAFFAERKAAQLPEIAGVEAPPFEEIGVIGGGTMGAGIATAAAMAGLSVVLVERETEFADKARQTIARNLAGAVERNKLSQEAHDRILNERLKTVVGYDALSNADIIIEAVFESMDVKKDVFKRLDEVAKAGATLATNTSYLDVNEIALATGRPQDVVGLHFFSPAHIMRLLEIVVADRTDKRHVVRAFALAKRFGKVGVRAGVCDGFIGNRILSHYRLAADYMMMDGASPYEIDAALTDFGFAMGPFQVADLAGIDIGYAARQRKAATRDPRERSVDFADTLYHKGWLGQKTGRGFYVYDSESPKGRPDPEVLDLLSEARREAGIEPRSFTAGEIQRRYMAAMINEAARVLSDGIAQRPSDIDVVLLFGYGFPRWRGGPLHYADAYGLENVLADIRKFAAEDPFYWSPAVLLEELVAESRSFSGLNEDSQTS